MPHTCERVGVYYCRGCLHNLLLNIQNQRDFLTNQESLRVAQQSTVFCITHVFFPVDPKLAFDTKIFRNRAICVHCKKTRKRKSGVLNGNAQLLGGQTLPSVGSINCAVDSVPEAYSQSLQNTAVVSSNESIYKHQCVRLSEASNRVNTQPYVELCMTAENMRKQQYKVYKYDSADFFETGISSSTRDDFADFLCLLLHSKNEHASSKNYSAFSVAYLQLHLRGLYAQLQTCCVMLDEIDEYLQNIQAVYDLHARIQASKINSSKLHHFFYKNMRTYPTCCSLLDEFQTKLQCYSIPHTFYDSKWNEVEMASIAKFVRLPLTLIWNFSAYRRSKNKSSIDKSAACGIEDIVGFELAEIDNNETSGEDEENDCCTWQEKIMLNNMVMFDGNQKDCNGLKYGREELMNKLDISFCTLGVVSNFVQKYNDITRKLQCARKQELDLNEQKIAAKLRCLRNEFELDLKTFCENSDVVSKLHQIVQLTEQSTNFLEILLIATDFCKVLRQEFTKLHKKYSCRLEEHLQDGHLNNGKFWKQNTTKFRNLYKFGAWSEKSANFGVGTLHQILFQLYDNVSLCAQHHCIDSYIILVPQHIVHDYLILGTKQNRDFFVLHIANLKLFMQSNFFITSENWNIFEQNLQFLDQKFVSISSDSEHICALKLPMCLFLMTAKFFNNGAWKMLCFGKLKLFFGIMSNDEDKKDEHQMCNYDFCEAGNSIYTHQYRSSSYYL